MSIESAKLHFAVDTYFLIRLNLLKKKDNHGLKKYSFLRLFIHFSSKDNLWNDRDGVSGFWSPCASPQTRVSAFLGFFSFAI